MRRPPWEKGPFLLRNLDPPNRKEPGGGGEGSAALTLRTGPPLCTLNGHEPSDPLAFGFLLEQSARTLDNLLTLTLHQAKMTPSPFAQIPFEPLASLTLLCIPAGNTCQLCFPGSAGSQTSGFWLGSVKRSKSRREGEQVCSPAVYASCGIISSGCASSMVSRTGWKNWNFWVSSLVAKEPSPWTCECSVYLHFSSQLSKIQQQEFNIRKKQWRNMTSPVPESTVMRGVAIVTPSPAAVHPSGHTRTLRALHASRDLGRGHPRHLQREQVSENQAQTCALDKCPTIPVNRRIWEWLHISLESEAATNKQRWIFFSFYFLHAPR